jgi:YggT family protein
MLMSVLLFLVDTAFFFFVGAALLRAWMNSQRLRMTQQPGLFVMAMTDWLVTPLRKALPRRWMQANTDWGSLMAALLLALLYATVWFALVGGWAQSLNPLAWLFSLPWIAAKFLLRTALQGVMLLAIAYAVLSWVQPFSPMQGTLSRLIDPVLGPIRRVVPQIGGVDLSVLVLFVLLQIGLMLLG